MNDWTPFSHIENNAVLLFVNMCQHYMIKWNEKLWNKMNTSKSQSPRCRGIHIISKSAISFYRYIKYEIQNWIVAKYPRRVCMWISTCMLSRFWLKPWKGRRVMLRPLLLSRFVVHNKYVSMDCARDRWSMRDCQTFTFRNNIQRNNWN